MPNNPYDVINLCHRRDLYYFNIASFLQISYTLNEAPQPQVVVALGLLTKKREPSRPSV